MFNENYNKDKNKDSLYDFICNFNVVYLWPRLLERLFVESRGLVFFDFLRLFFFSAYFSFLLFFRFFFSLFFTYFFDVSRVFFRFLFVDFFFSFLKFVKNPYSFFSCCGSLGAFFIKWVFSTNHKHIGILYIYLGFLSGIFGTTLSLIIRQELITPVILL